MRNTPPTHQPAIMLIGAVVRNFRTTAEDFSVVGSVIRKFRITESYAVVTKKRGKKKDGQ